MRTVLFFLVSCTGDKDGFTEYNTPPAASVTLPADGSSFNEGDAVELRGVVDDAQDDVASLEVHWLSDLDGELFAGNPDVSGTTTLATSNLRPGNHTITLQVLDSDGEAAEDYVSVSILDLEDAPEIAWIHPISGEYGEEGVAFEFKVEAHDLQDDPADLQVLLSSSIDGEFCVVELDGAGIGTCPVALSVGAHTLTATVIDLDDNSQAVNAYFEVVAGTTTDDDADGWTETQGDCDDADGDVNPRAEEVENGVDDNCDGTVDEGTAAFDDDGDCYCDGAESCVGSVEASCTTLGLDDCDDDDASVYPTAPETCDNEDNDCDLTIDEGTVCYDDDGDGYTESTGDCDDASPYTYPRGTELADAADNDCDGTVDEGTDQYDDDGDCACESETTCLGSIDAACTTLGFGDCDDDAIDVFPDADEVCNDLDDNCDGDVDGGAIDAPTWYGDADTDGFGSASAALVSCDAPAGYVANGADCDDLAVAVNPAATEVCDAADNNCDGVVDTDAVDADTWYFDGDGDTYGDTSTATVACDAGTNYVGTGGDCDDRDSGVHPAASERCDDLDNNCDGSIDGSDATDRTTWYADADGDTYGTSSLSTTACDAPSGYVSRAGDCNDATASASPAGTESCDSLDNDCDGATDEGVTATYYRDADGDSYGTPSTYVSGCSAPSGYVTNDDDCNDSASSAYPGRAETCDSLDNDCDGSTDEGVTTTYYRDADGDGYGTSSTTSAACSAPSGYVATSGDCNDSSGSAYPGRAETCDSADNDCDGSTDEGVTTRYYRDADGDGYGTASTYSDSCSAPAGYVATSTDCNDSNASINPSTVWYRDADGDSYGSASVTSTSCTQPSGYVSNDDDCNDGSSSQNPSRTESCDSVDNDCDGSTDEANASGCSTYYYDYDNDSYGSSTSACLCAASGYYDTRTTGDCYDSNANAYPGASSWRTTSRGDGSYDYNCDSTEEKRYTNDGICHVDFWAGTCDMTSGFLYSSSVPSCGVTDDYVTSCTYYGVYCGENTSSYTQGCR